MYPAQFSSLTTFWIAQELLNLSNDRINASAASEWGQK
jgi:hypothetical protein